MLNEKGFASIKECSDFIIANKIPRENMVCIEYYPNTKETYLHYYTIGEKEHSSEEEISDYIKADEKAVREVIYGRKNND